MSVSRASQSINLPQLQNLIKRDPESYRDEVCTFSALCLWSVRNAHVVGVMPQFRVARFLSTKYGRFCP